MELRCQFSLVIPILMTVIHEQTNAHKAAECFTLARGSGFIILYDDSVIIVGILIFLSNSHP